LAPTATILAGPNGAGKTTFMSAYFRGEASSPLFVNADEIARYLDPHFAGTARDMRAGRLMLKRLDEVVRSGQDFVIETTLATTLYVRRIQHWRECGYRIALVYVRLPSVDASLRRVRRRAARGGHPIPERDILRRFDRSLVLLETVYKPVVDHWQVFDSVEGEFVLSDWSDR
jgi:predicted ABC-type ATPase